MPSISSADRIRVATYSVHLARTDVSKESGIPVGAIVGGMVGGAVLAILCMAGWVVWGKAVRRMKEKRKREAEALRTRSNTRYNASALSRPWIEAGPPRVLRPFATRVKFTPSGEKGGALPRFSSPKPLRSAKVSAEKGHAPMGVPRLPSTVTVSSVSLYSAESAEEHQIRAPTSLILAALGSVEAAFTRRRGGTEGTCRTEGHRRRLRLRIRRMWEWRINISKDTTS
ncbi:hypothetical protein B0H10DRAFT_345082 [Mycena sp. CBHHK59/15]|nr:hypothetical protein B0H10DRAFT_345082 [Mycena sp. CBHHK59/15]